MKWTILISSLTLFLALSILIVYERGWSSLALYCFCVLFAAILIGKGIIQ